MTTRDLVDSPTIRIALYALALGIAWATLEAKVNRVEEQKADKSEVQGIRGELGELRSITLDMLCVQQPENRRCK
jgi:hypothetical protein